MKKKTIVAIAIAAVLIVAGAGLAAVAFEMAGGARQLFSDESLSVVPGYNRSDRNEGSIGSWPSGEETVIDVDKIVVNWLSGSVVIQGADVNEISFSESADRQLDENSALVYRIENGTLYIDYCQEKNVVGIFGDGFDMPAKELKITVPLEMMFISVDTTSADVTLNGVELERLSIDTTSGRIDTRDVGADSARLGSTSGDIDFNGGAEEFYANTTSGEITFSGSAGEFDAESTSGDISFVGSAKGFSADTTSGSVFSDFTGLPADLEAETVSGDVTLILPADAGFVLDFETASGKLDCEFAVKMYDGEYIVGNGGTEISVDTSSGDCTVKIRK